MHSLIPDVSSAVAIGLNGGFSVDATFFVKVLCISKVTTIDSDTRGEEFESMELRSTPKSGRQKDVDCV